MTLSEELQWRGFVNQTTFADISDVDTPRTFYWGVDPSADSMHIGQLAMAMMIRAFMAHGHTAILLVGGATGMVGDPGGKDKERDLKSIDEIEHNKAGIMNQYRMLFAEMPFTMVDNYDWFRDMNYLKFLRDIGKRVSLTQMLDREFIKSRIGEAGGGISYAEFSYALIQGYDFLHLFREHDATLQIAGSDQWGNSVAGVEMIRKIDGGEAHVWTAPLILDKTTGKKFGKSEGNAVWIDPTKTSVYKFYQFWLNVDDVGVADYLKIYTLITPHEYDLLMEEFRSNPSSRAAQKYLAYEVTKLVHGVDRADNARNITSTLFGDTPFTQLLEEELTMLALEIPTTTAGNVLDALVMSGLVGSNGEARRLVESDAISVNGEKVTTPDTTLPVPSLLKKGKNNFLLVK
ncbi:MAG: tyrosine--tRNA ligase [Candidatus Saccharimonadales bacterium]|jgi:tyrosyl-tRNA synthetase